MVVWQNNCQTLEMQKHIFLKYSVCKVNTLRPKQSGHHFADSTFKCIFLKENLPILIKISLKFVPRGPIHNNPALVQIIAWHQPGIKPLSMMVRLPTHICVTRPQWINQHPIMSSCVTVLTGRIGYCFNIKTIFLGMVITITVKYWI